VNETPVDVLLAVPGEGVYFRPTEADRELSAWLSPGMTLYAAGEYSQPLEGFPDARYWVVFLNSRGAGNDLILSVKGVVAVGFDLSFNAARIAAEDAATGGYLIPPP
jgi:hypothetical protein